MDYRQLGGSGLRVPTLGIGGNVFGQHGPFQHFNDAQATAAILHRAADIGANFIDTADIYADGSSETYIGKAIVGQRDRFIIASKVGLASINKERKPERSGPNQSGLSRGHIMTSIEGTLRRLDTDYVDLYYAHMPDPTTPLEETLRAFDDLVRQGKVRYVACSNFAGWQIAGANALAAQRGYAPFVVNQAAYNLFERAIEAEIVPACLHHGLQIVAYSPLAQGVLTGKYRPGEPIPAGTRAWQNPSALLARYLTPGYLHVVQQLDAWAQDHGHRVGELALAWVLAKPFICSVITAVTSCVQLETNVKAAAWRLTTAQIQEIEAIVAANL